MEHSIEFFTQDVGMPALNFDLVRGTLNSLVEHHGFGCGPLSVVFCDNSYLLKVNQQFLDHDYYTDIITFNYSSKRIISGDLFISTEMVKENAERLGNLFSSELSRVIIHGVLHLLGYDDHSESDIKEMRKQEDLWLAYIDTH